MAESTEPAAPVRELADKSTDAVAAPLDRRFVLFVDYLGASAAATKWPAPKVRQVIDLLTGAHSLQQPQAIAWNDAEGIPHTFSVAPEITTFSDNIVISYPEVPEILGPILDQVWAGLVCHDAIRMVSWLAEAGLRIGLLLRGGLALDRFYHQDGVTFGAGLVRAYDLERKAHMPRVVVDDAVLSRFLSPPADLLIKDADGKWRLDYFRDLARHGYKNPGGLGSRADWRRLHLETIDRAIAEAQAAVDCKAQDRVKKWHWFKEQFLHARRPLRT